MGLMKEFLMEKTHELAGKLGIPEKEFYVVDSYLQAIANAYAQYQLEQDSKKDTTREEIKKAILTRTDEVIDLIQGILGAYVCEEVCANCDYSFLCETSTQYKGGKE